MKRFTAIIAAFSFFTMITIDSSACYLMMLTCEPVIDCSVAPASSPQTCQSSCGLPKRQKRVSCQPDDPPVSALCIIVFSSDISFNSSCECQLTPPLTSILAERRTLDTKSSTELPVIFGIKLNQSDRNTFIRDSRPQGIHLTIPTTVLRC